MATILFTYHDLDGIAVKEAFLAPGNGEANRVATEMRRRAEEANPDVPGGGFHYDVLESKPLPFLPEQPTQITEPPAESFGPPVQTD